MSDHAFNRFSIASRFVSGALDFESRYGREPTASDYDRLAQLSIMGATHSRALESSGYQDDSAGDDAAARALDDCSHMRDDARIRLMAIEERRAENDARIVNQLVDATRRKREAEERTAAAREDWEAGEAIEREGFDSLAPVECEQTKARTKLQMARFIWAELCALDGEADSDNPNVTRMVRKRSRSTLCYQYRLALRARASRHAAAANRESA